MTTMMMSLLFVLVALEVKTDKDTGKEQQNQ
jgi:hypothetical protein